MSWEEVDLGDCFTIKHGYAFKGEHFADFGQHIVLTPGNFHEGGGFRARPGKDRYYAVEPPESFILSADDLVIAMTEQGEGLLGSSALIPSHGSYLHNQRIGLIEGLNVEKMDKRFLYYLFNTPFVRGQIRASATGGKVRHTAPKRVYSIRVRIPDVSAQRKIADILGAYDGLIENNQRRIGLFEEAARTLFREWFVRLRFPGYEHVGVVDGLPDGWERGALGQVAVIRKGRNITREIAVPGAVPVVAGGLKPAYSHSEANAEGPVVTVSASGANAGHVAIYYVDIWASDCSYLSSADNENLFYMYELLKSKQAEITAMQKGAAQPHVYPKDLEKLKILVPPTGLKALYETSVVANFAIISNLYKQNDALVQARDFLLPRLMNGDIAA